MYTVCYVPGNMRKSLKEQVEIHVLRWDSCPNTEQITYVIPKEEREKSCPPMMSGGAYSKLPQLH